MVEILISGNRYQVSSIKYVNSDNISTLLLYNFINFKLLTKEYVQNINN